MSNVCRLTLGRFLRATYSRTNSVKALMDKIVR